MEFVQYELIASVRRLCFYLCLLGLVHTETFSCVFVLFTVLKGIENNQLITWNNTKTQENVSVFTEPRAQVKRRTSHEPNYSQ